MNGHQDADRAQSTSGHILLEQEAYLERFTVLLRKEWPIWNTANRTG